MMKIWENPSLKTKEGYDSIMNKESSTIAKKCLLGCPHNAPNVIGFIALQYETLLSHDVLCYLPIYPNILTIIPPRNSLGL